MDSMDGHVEIQVVMYTQHRSSDTRRHNPEPDARQLMQCRRDQDKNHQLRWPTSQTRIPIPAQAEKCTSLACMSRDTDASRVQ